MSQYTMRFYRRDGSCKSDRDDSDFGWWFCDIINDEQIDSRDKCPTKIIVEKNVKEDAVVGTQETLMSPEGYDCKTPERKSTNKWIEYENWNPIKEKLSNLISSNTLRSQLLMSVVDFSRFQKLIEQDCDTCIKAVVDSSTILNLHFMKNVCKHPNIDPTLNFKLNCLQSDCLKFSTNNTSKEKFFESTDLLYENLKILNDKIKEMQKELVPIKMYFQEEDERSGKLLKEYRKLSREVRESNYLNEILLLLMGKAEKIKSNNWPFRICSNQDQQELNFIV